jgi:hypothetical protein
MGTTSTSTTLTLLGVGGKDVVNFASSTGTSLFRITQAGNVGIGTTTPIQALSVAGNFYISGSATSTIENNLHVMGNLKVGTGSINVNNTGIFSTDGALVLSSTGSSTISNTVIFGGRVKFNGLDEYSGALNLTGVLCLDADGKLNKLTGAGLCVISSREYKDNIVDLNHGIDWVRQLRPVTFDFKSNGSSSLGFIAEEVDEVSPLLSIRNEKGKVYSVHYELIGAVLTKAVQEIDSIVTEMKTQFDALKTKIDTMFAWFGGNGDRFNIKGLVCVDDVCVTKDQFKQLLINSGSVVVVPQTQPQGGTQSSGGDSSSETQASSNDSGGGESESGTGNTSGSDTSGDQTVGEEGNSSSESESTTPTEPTEPTPTPADSPAPSTEQP